MAARRGEGKNLRQSILKSRSCAFGDRGAKHVKGEGRVKSYLMLKGDTHRTLGAKVHGI